MSEAAAAGGVSAPAQATESAGSQANAPTQAPAKEWKGFGVKQPGSASSAKPQAQDGPPKAPSAGQPGLGNGNGKGTGAGTGKGAEPARSAAQPGASTEDDLEELKLGSHTARVPKELAKAIKELERGFHGKSQEAAGTRRQFEQFVSQAKQNPEWFFQQTGIDPDQFSQARLADKLKREMMSPADRKALEQEQELSKYRKTEQERQTKEIKEREERDFQQLNARVRQEALQSVGKSEEIRDDPYLVARVFAVKGAADEKNLAWDWDKCVDYVEKEQRASYTKRFSSLTPQQLEERLGAGALSKWREYDLKRVTEKSALGSGSSSQGRPGGSPASPRQEVSKKGLSEAEYRDYWKRMQGE